MARRDGGYAVMTVAELLAEWSPVGAAAVGYVRALHEVAREAEASKPAKRKRSKAKVDVGSDPQ
jgi:hypothetical protein